MENNSWDWKHELWLHYEDQRLATAALPSPPPQPIHSPKHNADAQFESYFRPRHYSHYSGFPVIGLLLTCGILQSPTCTFIMKSLQVQTHSAFPLKETRSTSRTRTPLASCHHVVSSDLFHLSSLKNATLIRSFVNALKGHINYNCVRIWTMWKWTTEYLNKIGLKRFALKSIEVNSCGLNSPL